MYITVPIALFGYLLVGPLLFVVLPPRRAMIVSMLLGTMFLPNAGYQMPVLRSFDKGTATVYATILGIVLFDGSRLLRLRLSWVDIPMIVWCLCPMASSITNGLGVYDGLADIMSQINLWGLPYLIARVYIRDRHGARELAVGLAMAGLIYLPFCLWEMKAGPFFHAKVYGFYPHNYWEQHKPDGWRPSVFFVHGLWLAGFMAYAAISALCLWWSRSVVRVWKSHIKWPAITLIVVLLDSHSNGAIAIFGLGAMVVFAGRYRRLVCSLLIAVPPVYTTVRMTGLWSGKSLVQFWGGEKAQAGGSLNTRLQLEDRIVERALEQPAFGWGGDGRAFRIATTDARGTWTEAIWTREFGTKGLVGLWAWMLSGLLPAWLALRHLGDEQAIAPGDGAVLAMIIIAAMHIIYGLVVLDLGPVSPMLSGAEQVWRASELACRSLEPA